MNPLQNFQDLYSDDCPDLVVRHIEYHGGVIRYLGCPVPSPRQFQSGLRLASEQLNDFEEGRRVLILHSYRDFSLLPIIASVNSVLFRDFMQDITHVNFVGQMKMVDIVERMVTMIMKKNEVTWTVFGGISDDEMLPNAVMHSMAFLEG